MISSANNHKYFELKEKYVTFKKVDGSIVLYRIFQDSWLDHSV
jgi:hypothetical protein